jgi:cytoskeletal protein CcmA (bactofilin family)
MKRLLVALVALCTLLPAAPALAADDNDTPDDRIVLSGSVLVDRDEVVPGDVVVVDGDILIRGTVDGDVVAVSGDVTIRGKVGGDVVAVDGLATLGRAARVSGDLTYFDKKPVVAPGAKVAGKVEKIDGGEIGDALKALAFGIWIAFSVSLVLFGLILLLLAPKAAEAIARTAKARWGMAIGVGLGAFILLPIVAVLIALTVIGTPLGIILLATLVPLFAMAYVASALVVGRLILKGSKIPAFLLGILILCLLTLIPFAGGLIATLAIIFGLGLLFTTLFRARS